MDFTEPWITNSSKSTQTPNSSGAERTPGSHSGGISRCSTGLLESGDTPQGNESNRSAKGARRALEKYCNDVRIALRKAASISCPKQHTLHRFFTKHGRYSCDCCRAPQAQGALMKGCQQCGYDLCSQCSELEKVDRLEGAVMDVLGWLEKHPQAERVEVEAKLPELQALAEGVLTAIARPLTTHFEGDYVDGGVLTSARYRKGLDQSLQLQVYEHGATGIKVWAEAVDLRGEAPLEPYMVLFYYTSRTGLGCIAPDGADRAAALAGTSDPQGHFGSGIYTSCREPQVFGSKEAVLYNCYWPRVGDSQVTDPGHATHLLARGNPDAGPEDKMNRPVCEAILADAGQRQLADYCVPLLVPQRFAFNIWERMPPDLAGWCPGCNRWGEQQWAGRDLWVVQVAFPAAVNSRDCKVGILRKRLELLHRAKGRHHADTLDCVSTLAWMLKDLGQYADAEGLFRYEMQASEELCGPAHPDTLTAADNLAGLLKAMGIFEEAECLYHRALQGSVRKLGHSHADTLTSLNNLAGVLKATGKLSEAEALYRRALRGSEDTLGPKHPDTLTSMCNLAEVYRAQGNLDEAERLHRGAWKLREEILGVSDLRTLRSMCSLATVLEEKGGMVEAEQLLWQAYHGARDALGLVHPETEVTLNCLLELLLRLGRHQEVAQLQAEHPHQALRRSG